MTAPPAPSSERAPPTWQLVALGVLGGAVLAAIVAWLAMGEPPPPAVTTTTRPTPSVLLAVRDLARLEATEMHMERVIEMTDTQRVLWGVTEAEDSILLVAAADVVAGVDLGALGEEDVVVDEVSGAVTITVPRPVVFSSRLDSARTFVHARSTDMLAERSETLESRARAEAERTLGEAALEAGIVDRAETSVRRTLTSLVTALGHAQVEIRFR